MSLPKTAPLPGDSSFHLQVPETHTEFSTIAGNRAVETQMEALPPSVARQTLPITPTVAHPPLHGLHWSFHRYLCEASISCSFHAHGEGNFKLADGTRAHASMTDEEESEEVGVEEGTLAALGSGRR